MTAAQPKSKAWRDRAEEYRAYAAESKSAEARQTYLEVAANCDLIASRLERLDRSEAGHRETGS